MQIKLNICIFNKSTIELTITKFKSFGIIQTQVTKFREKVDSLRLVPLGGATA